MTMTRADTTPIIAIDLVRFACAMLVVVYHVDVGYWLSPSNHAASVLTSYGEANSGMAISRVGWVGVEIFFVISGLVIARSALQADWRSFVRRRFLRLVPAVWICATVTFAMLAASGHFGPAIGFDWLRSVAFWPIGNQIDDVYWTLGVETFFYLAVAITLGSHGTPQRIEQLAWVLGLVSAAGWLATLFQPTLMLAVMSNQAATLLLLPYGVFFALGMMIAAIHTRPLGPARGALMVVLTAAALIEISAHSEGREAAMAVAVSGSTAQGIFLVALGVVILAPHLQTPLSRWISPGTARTVGLMTYPLYLIHQDAGAVVIATLLGHNVPLRVAQALTVLLMLVLAWAIARWPEPWLRARLATLFNRFRDRAPDTRPTASPSAG